MVIMLCLGTAARADLVAGYSFNGNLNDCSGNGNDGTAYEGTPGFSSSVPSGGSGGMSLDLDGTNSVEIPLDPEMFDGTSPFSIVAWFRTSSTEPSNVMVSCSSPTGTTEQSAADDTPFAVLVFETIESGYVAEYDQFYNNAAGTETGGLNDGAWHHFAVVYDGSGVFTTYLDGALDRNPDQDGTEPWEFAPGYDPDHSNDDTVVCIGNIVNPFWSSDAEDFGDGHFDGQLEDVGIYDHALSAGEVGDAKSDGYSCYGPKNPLRVDPNTMLVYETGETTSNFTIQLKFPPVGQGGPGSPQGTPYEITVLIDPNGGNGGWDEGPIKEKDIQLLDTVLPDNQIILTFDENNWNVPRTFFFKAIDDPCAEPPLLTEITPIGITITSTVDEPNLNGNLDPELNPFDPCDPCDVRDRTWNRNINATVGDNDQANILFTYTGPYFTSPSPVDVPILEEGLLVKVWEQTPYSYGVPQGVRKRRIGITLQVPPDDGDPCTSPDTVKLNASILGEIAGDNRPNFTPAGIPYKEIDEPNALYFTAGNFATPQYIEISGNDDDRLQVEAGADGGEFYEVELSVWVIDNGGDERYDKFTEAAGLAANALDDDGPRVVNIGIEDNECGAYGILDMDIGNPDPCDLDYNGNPNPDCYVNIYDALEIVTRWFNCSDPQTVGCIKYNTEEVL